MLRAIQWLVLAVLASLSIGTQVQAGFVITAEAPDKQTTSVSTGVTTESFNSFSTGLHTSLTTAVGTVTANGPGLQILAADQYGGVGGTGNYINIGRANGGTSMTLTFFNPVSYFGFEWEAADSANKLELLSGGHIVATFNPTTALGDLSNSYKGNPDNGQDSGEKFAFLNFFGTSGTTFDQVIFLNSNATGFESDNWTVRTDEVPPPYPGTPLVGALSVPEPSSLALTAMGCGGLLFHVVRRRRRAS